MTPESRSLRARMAAHVQWSREPDRTARTAKARRSFDARFERQVDPDGVLDPQVRARMAANAKTAYFLNLAAKSAKARAARKKTN